MQRCEVELYDLLGVAFEVRQNAQIDTLGGWRLPQRVGEHVCDG
jgi:hypothetical protein